MNINYPNFIFEFARTLEISLIEAEKIWAAFSKDLSAEEKESIECGGKVLGRCEAIYYSIWINLNNAKKE